MTTVEPGPASARVEEAERLRELASFRVLDTDFEPAFDALVRTAALVAGTSSALVGLIDDTRQWYKAKFGVTGDQVPRDESVCRTVIETDRELVISDLTQDDRFNMLPAVTAAEPVRFYAGFPLRTSSGAVLGTLCVLDSMPGELDGVETAILRTLADQVMAQLQLRREVMERAEAARALGASEQRLRYLLENSHDVVARHRLDGSVIDISPGVDNLLGLDPQDPESWDLNAKVHPEDMEAFGTAFFGAVNGEPSAVTGRIRHADGAYRHLEIAMRPMLDEAGNVVEIIATTRDATERIGATEALARAQAEIRRRQVMLEESEELAGIGSWNVDLGSGDFSWSPGMHRLFRTDLVPGFELTRERHLAFLHPDDRERMVAHVEQTIATGETSDFEHRIVRADGQVRVLLGRARAELGPDGGPVRIGGAAQDVTEARRQDREVEAARDQFVQLLGAATEQAIVGTDTDGRITLFNKGAERMTGWTAEEALGQVPWSFLHDQAELAERSEGRDASEFRQVTRDGSHTADGRGQLRPAGTRGWTWAHKDGRPVSVQIALTPMQDEDGRFAGHLGIATDVSEQRRAERERDEATAAISRARDEALAANAAKSAFLATMSHEIRTPMNAVIGMTGLLLDTPLTGEQEELLETVRSSGDQLLAIINDILDFSKIESGDLDLEARAFDLRDLVEGTVAQFAGAARGLELVSLVDDDAPARVVGDVTRLRQVLTNLVGNAVKFTHEGDVLVRVRTEPRATSSKGASSSEVGLRFEVRDTGIGIPAESMHRLFKSFSQVDASTTRTYGGTGLGLAISHALVAAMGGELGVESEPGAGSTFAFTIGLPLDDDADVPLPPRLGGRRVLLVVPNATVRRVARTQLEAQGAVVVEAADGESARRPLVAEDRFDVAILDPGPQSDRDQLTRRLEAVPRTGAPLILFSGVGRRPDVADLFAAVLTKPVRGTTLVETVARVLSPASQVPAQATGSPAPAVPGKVLRILLAEDNEVN